MFATLPKSTYAILVQQRCVRLLLSHIPVYLRPPIIHGKNVARMWISVKKTKLQELTQGSLQFYSKSSQPYTFPPSQLDSRLLTLGFYKKMWTQQLKQPTGACTPFRMNSLMSIPRRLAQLGSTPNTKQHLLLVP